MGSLVMIKAISGGGLTFYNSFMLHIEPGYYLFIYFSLVYINFSLQPLSGMRGMLLSLFLINHNYIRMFDRSSALLFLCLLVLSGELLIPVDWSLE